MKRFFLISALLISFNSFAQFISLNELINLSNSNVDYFDTYATRKGYTFYKADTNENTNSIIYSFLVNGIKKGYLVKYTYNKKEGGWIELQTPNSNTYLKFKESLKVNGFSFYDKGVSGETSWIKYKKGKTTVEIFSASDYDEFTRTTTPSYEITVQQN